jgi:type II secretory pathway pseudopilin PulG
MPVASRERGFTLIEAAVAAGLLLAACVAVSHTMLITVAGEGTLAARAQVEALAEAERVRLLALPYFIPAGTSGGTGQEAAPSSLLAEVFPSTTAGPDAVTGYQQDAAGAASFVSRLSTEEATLERHARFVRRGANGTWQALSAADLAGWSSAGAAPPAATVEVLITATCRGRSAQRRLLTGAPTQSATDEPRDAQ